MLLWDGDFDWIPGSCFFLAPLLAIGGAAGQWRRLSPQQRNVAHLTFSFPIAYGFWAIIPFLALADAAMKWVLAELAFFTLIAIPTLVGSLSVIRFWRYGIYAGAVGLFLFWSAILSSALTIFWR